jgi:hypothetical protein
VEKKIFKGYKQPGASLPRGVPAIVNGVAVSAVGSERSPSDRGKRSADGRSTVDDQATKGGWWMPWGQKPKKGAAHRDRPWGAASMRGAMGTRMRQLPRRDGRGSRFIGKGTGGTETS